MQGEIVDYFYIINIKRLLFKINIKNMSNIETCTIHEGLKELKSAILDLKETMNKSHNALLETLESTSCISRDLQSNSFSLKNFSRDLQSLKYWLPSNNQNCTRAFLDQAYLESQECNKYIWWLTASQHYNLMLQVGQIFPEHEADRYMSRGKGLWSVPRY